MKKSDDLVRYLDHLRSKRDERRPLEGTVFNSAAIGGYITSTITTSPLSALLCKALQRLKSVQTQPAESALSEKSRDDAPPIDLDRHNEVRQAGIPQFTAYFSDIASAPEGPSSFWVSRTPQADPLMDQPTSFCYKRLQARTSQNSWEVVACKRW